jgi:DNA (cytosine-5)-methyltransferase 1
MTYTYRMNRDSWKYGSICSGIEAATIAWHSLGWQPAFFSEIEAFPRAVLAHHYPEVPLHGDFTTIGANEYGPINLLVGGTPCQDFSVAGLRAGLDGERGDLTIEFLKLADRLRPKWLVWENVPGVFSANEGRAFGAIIGALGKLGYGWAYRVLDAQYFGVPQRRRRVFIVGCFGNANAAAAVLFERASVSGYPAPSRKAGEDASYCVTSRFGSGRNDPTAETYLAAFGWNKSASQTLRVSETSTDALQANSTSNPEIAYQCHGTNVGPMGTLRQGNGDVQSGVPFLPAASAVRRLTPRECERLQGFSETKNEVIIRVCSDASFVEQSSFLATDTGQASHNEPVAVSALIDLELGTLQLLSPNGSPLYAGPADERSSFPLPTGIGSFARLAVLTTQTSERITPGGRAASPRNTIDSMLRKNGSIIVLLSGREIESAADAIGDLAVATDTSITSGVGLSSQTLERTMRTLSSCAVRAIASFIPEEIRRAISYDVRLSTTQGYTLVPYRGKPAADGPRYRALGNSMAVPVMRWIGERIAMVEQIITKQSAA